MGQGDDTVQHTIDGTKPAQIAVNAEPPVLCRCIVEGEIEANSTDLEKAVNGGQPPPDFSDPAKYTETVQAVMKHLVQRLKGGIDEAWASTAHGYGARSALWGKPGESINSIEEQWARAFSEMVVFACYGGIGSNHGFTPDTEMVLFSWFDKTQRDAPAFPIMLACQHLSTYLVLSRGVPPAQCGPNGMTASNGTAGLPLFAGKKLGEWRYKGKRAKEEGRSAAVPTNQLDDIKALIKANILTPGSVFAYDSLGAEDVSQTGKAHIGSVLRVWGGGFQPIDTGPMAGGAHADEGSADHSLQTGTVDAGSVLAGTFVGAGFIYGTETAPTQEHVDYIKKARPLGFAQLVLADEKKMIRFVSRMLPMYSGSDNFSVSRFAWSLRALPANLTAIWILSIAKNAGLTRDLSEGKAVKDMSPRDAHDKPQMPNKNDGLWAYPLIPTHVILGVPTSDPKKSEIHLYRRKIGPESPTTHMKDNWKKQGTGEEATSPTGIFPEHLRKFRFSGNVVDSKGTLATMAWKWRQMQLGSPDWTMKDPTDKENSQVADVATGIPYFGD